MLTWILPYTHMHCIKCRLLYMLCCWTNQSVSVFIHFFLIRIRKIHLYNICTFIRWLLCVLLSRFSVKSAKAVTCGLPCHLDRKFLKMWKSWGQSFPLIKKEDKQKKKTLSYSSAYLPHILLFLFFTNSVIFFPLSCQIALGEKDFCFSHLAFNILLTCGIVLATIMEF